MKSKEDIERMLGQFTGTEKWHRHSLVPKFLYTDGIEWLAMSADAFWLIDLAASYQVEKKFWDMPFQLWTVTVDLKAGKGMAVMQQDLGMPEEIVQEFGHSDFPLEEFKFYVVDDGTTDETLKVMLLPSEY